MMKTNLRNIALQILGKEYKLRFISIWVSLALWILPIQIASFTSLGFKYLFPFTLVGGVSFFVLTPSYFKAVHSLKKSLRTLESTNKLEYVSELISGDYNVSGNVCFSENLMYCKKHHKVVAYDDIETIKVNILNGFQRLPVFGTIDGEYHILDLEDNLIKELVLRKPNITVKSSSVN